MSHSHFVKLLKLLDERGYLSAAAKQCSMPEESQVLTKLLELGIAADALTDALAETFNLEVYSSTVHGALEITGKRSNWGIAGEYFFISNPFDSGIQPIAVLSSVRSARIRCLGLLPVSGASITATLRESYAEAEGQIREWLESAARLNASDLHIAPLSANYVRIRARIDGYLNVLDEMPIVSDKPGQSYLNISNMLLRLAGLESGSFTKPVDGRFCIELVSARLEIRVHMRPVLVQAVLSQAFYLRLFNLRDSSHLKRFKSLQLPQQVEEAFSELRRSNQNLILVCGPTGSGKTTTLYANLQEILHETPERSIQTLEDPVECHIEGIEQTEINEQAGMGFEMGLRAMMRSDVDVILVGEVRDSATAKLTVRASLTGHLVFATIHAKSALSAIERLVELGVSRKMLAIVLTGIFSQRLVRKLCDVCKGNQSTRCENCSQGYQGRYPIAEIIKMDEELREAVLRGDSLMQLESLAHAKGNLTLLECATDLSQTRYYDIRRM